MARGKKKADTEAEEAPAASSSSEATDEQPDASEPASGQPESEPAANDDSAESSSAADDSSEQEQEQEQEQPSAVEPVLVADGDNNPLLQDLPRVEYPLVRVKVGRQMAGHFDLQGVAIPWPIPNNLIDRAGTRTHGHNTPTVIVPQVMYESAYEFGSMKSAQVVDPPLVLIPIGSGRTSDQVEEIKGFNHRAIRGRLGQGDAVETEALTAKEWAAII